MPPAPEGRSSFGRGQRDRGPRRRRAGYALTLRWRRGRDRPRPAYLRADRAGDHCVVRDPNGPANSVDRAPSGDQPDLSCVRPASARRICGRPADDGLASFGARLPGRRNRCPRCPLVPSDAVNWAFSFMSAQPPPGEHRPPPAQQPAPRDDRVRNRRQVRPWKPSEVAWRHSRVAQPLPADKDIAAPVECVPFADGDGVRIPGANE
jgi:hypothetical protein